MRCLSSLTGSFKNISKTSFNLHEPVIYKIWSFSAVLATSMNIDEVVSTPNWWRILIPFK